MQAVGHYPNLEDVAVAKIVDNDFKTVTFIQITIGGIIRELVSPVVTQKGTISLYAHDGEWKTSDVYKECSDVEVKSKKKGKGKKNDSKKL